MLFLIKIIINDAVHSIELLSGALFLVIKVIPSFRLFDFVLIFRRQKIE